MKTRAVLLYLLVLLLPTQLGKHFWPDWSLVNGLRIDYLSPTIYLTDLLILGILGFWGAEIISNFQFPISKLFKKYWWVIAPIIFLLVNCFLAQNQPVAFYKLAKLAEFVLLGICIVKTRFSFNTFCLLLSTSVVYSSFLAIAQFLNQASLGGIFWFLGERTFNAGTPGIAQAVWNGQLILRPYATFSHPNVLAGFLVVGLLFILWYKPRFWWFSFLMGVIALLLTFSRSAWLVFGLSLLALAIVKKAKLVGVIGLGGMLIGILGILFLGQAQSWTLREDLNLVALKMMQSSPLWGVGLNNFLVKLPDFYDFSGPVYFLQPAHNIYLLTAAEIGLIGVIGLIGFLVLTIRRLILSAHYLILMALGAILVLGFFDHYFYTLQQGQLLAAVILGLAWSTKGRRVTITA